MALNKDTVYKTTGRRMLSVAPTVGVQFYVGALVGISRVTGLAVKWSDTADTVFIGLATENVLGSATNRLRVDCSGDVVLGIAVTGVDGVDDVGAFVYATDDATFTLTAGANVGPIGIVGRHNSSTNCDVRLFTPEEYLALTPVGDLILDGDVTITGKLTVTGPIDPPSLTLADNDQEVYTQFGAGESAAVSEAGTMRLIYDAVQDMFMISKDGAPYEEVGGGGITFPLEAPDGSVGAPSYSFENFLDSGMYAGAGDVAISTGGEDIAHFKNTAGAFQLMLREGTVSAPSLAPLTDATTGINLTATDVAVIHDGEDIAHFINNVAGPQALFRSGNVSAPGIAFLSEPTNGLISASGVVQILVNADTLLRCTDEGGGVAYVQVPDGSGAAGLAFLSDETSGIGLLGGTAVVTYVDGADILQVQNAGAGDQGSYINGYLALNDDPGVGLSEAGTARLRYNDATGDIEASTDGGAYAALGGTTFPLLATDGSAAAPSYGFAGGGGGMFMGAGSELSFSDGSNTLMRLAFGTVAVSGDFGIVWENQTSQAGASTGTLTNAPAAGNPTFWLKIAIDGSTYALPAWLVGA